ncbi:hypothetical protein OTK49_00825 [Vibrio coralliirubri]|uniref:hypothetical protein n=1 Tax=Vibrio coralliirubri TaxID=1516159 RepID=UPI0022851C29|nr:hypothetical protein [Vibrio coralliirubri]MCY9861074.1 hypothetical protein [Vibrio coralliirubri]
MLNIAGSFVFAIALIACVRIKLLQLGLLYDSQPLAYGGDLWDILSSKGAFKTLFVPSLFFALFCFAISWVSYVLFSVVMRVVVSPMGESFKPDSAECLSEAFSGNSRKKKLCYLISHREVGAPFIFGLSCVCAIVFMLGQMYKIQHEDYKFYSTTIKAPLNVVSVLTQHCDSNAAIYQNNTIVCDLAPLIESEVDFFNNEDGKAIVVVWNEDVSEHKVVFRVDAAYAPPTETVAEMNTQLQGHFDLANLELIRKYSSKVFSLEHRAAWRVLEL